MKTPTPGLRPLFNRSKSTARVELLIPAGAEIAVTDEVAAQFPSEFAPVGDTSKAAAVEERAAAAFATNDEPPAVNDENDEQPAEPVKPKAKRAPKG